MIQLPTPQFSIREIFSECIPRLRDAELKSCFAAELQNLEDASDRANKIFSSGSMPPPSPGTFGLEGVDQEQFTSLFKLHFQRPKSKGRVFHDRLMSATPHRRCPYCTERTVFAIDHYLPKSVFPSLTLTPTNLIPSCSDCNTYKGSMYPSSTNPPVIHPYFDKIPPNHWLKVEIEWGIDPVIYYKVDPKASTNAETIARLENHFNLFRLGELYGSHAAREVADNYSLHTKLFHNGGPEQLRAHLEEIVDTLSDSNSQWKPPLYRALLEDQQFWSSHFGAPITK